MPNARSRFAHFAFPTQRTTRDALSFFLFFAFILIFSLLNASQIHAQAEPAIVTLYVNGDLKGDVEISVDGESVFLPPEPILAGLRPYLSPEALKVIEYVATGTLALEDLRLAGIDTVFETDTLTLTLEIPVRFMQERMLGEKIKTILTRGPLIEPAFFSAFINASLRGGVSGLSGSEPSATIGSDLDGALNLDSWVAEASGNLSVGQSFSYELRSARIIRDFRGPALRLTGGIMDLPQTGLLGRVPVVGFAIASNPEAALGGGQTGGIDSAYSSRVLGDSGFIVTEKNARITVLVNGVVLRTESVRPGRYRIGDLAFVSGLNEVVIRVEEDGEEPVERRVPVSFDSSILEAGTFRYALGFGTDDFSPDRVAASGFLDFGIGGFAELGTSVQAGSATLLYGISAQVATPLGAFSADAALSWAYIGKKVGEKGKESLGWSAKGLYRLGFPGRPLIPQFGMGFEYTTASFSTPTFAVLRNPAGDIWRGTVQIVQSTPFGVSVALAGDYGSSDGLRRSFAVALGVSAGLDQGANMNFSATLDDRQGVLLPGATVSVLIIPDGGRTSARFRHSLGDSETGFDFSSTTGMGPGSLTATLGMENPAGPDGTVMTMNAGLKRTGEISDVSGSVWYLDNRSLAGKAFGASLTADGALVFADGLFALSRRVADSFVILRPESSFGDELVELRLGSSSVVSSGTGRASAMAGLSAYRESVASVDAPESPPEIAPRDSLLSLNPSYKSGLVVRPALSTTTWASGMLLDKGGKPVEWALGVLTDSLGNKLGEVFTDETGRFEAYGLDIGEFRIDWLTEDPSYTQIIIPSDSGGFVDLGLVDTTSPGGSEP